VEHIKKIKVSEVLLILAGALFLISTAVIWNGGSLTVWFVTKAVYAIGVIVLLFNH